MTSLEIHFNSSSEAELRLTGEGFSDILVFWPPADNLVNKTGVDFHFDTVLVTAVDKILKKNRIQAVSLNSVSVAGKYEQSSVSYLVALAVASALKIQ